MTTERDLGVGHAAELDLSSCDQEPIRIPGSIQPHGLLLVLDAEEHRIVQAAGDARRLLGRPAESLVGEPIEAALGAEAAAMLRRPPAGAVSGAMPLWNFEALELAPGQVFDVQVRGYEAGLLVEAEVLGLPGPALRPNALSLVQAMMGHLQAADTPRAFSQAAVEEVRSVTGFDRVMLYRFLPDDTGSVVAEARTEGIGSYMDLHFPASDIPKQARELYLRNWLRLIPDATYTPQPLVPTINPVTGAMLDMSDCALRSVSPIHLQYLRNMGVQASMSMSVIRGGKLWGLIACHHRTPWHLAPSLRTACELFAQMFSLQLEAIEQREEHAYSLKMRHVHEHLVNVMAREEKLAEGLIRHRPNLLDYVQAEGVALWIDGQYSAGGITPGETEVRELASWLSELAGDGVVALDRLSEVYPPAKAYAREASGVLALSVSRDPLDFILWFRPEVVETIQWAGNPDKPVEHTAGGVRLSPRSSFESWNETVRGRSRPWRAVEIEAAQALHVSLLEVVLRRIDQVSQERSKAKEQQELLMAELDHRVKNTLANIQALVRHTRSGAGNLENFVHDFDRRIRAMAVAHSLLTTARWEGADLRALIEEELRPYRANEADRAVVNGPVLRLKPKAALAVSLALHELATNAAKYGALSVPQGRVSVVWSVRDGEVVLDWIESGGPPVRKPTRRGFGSTVVERGLSYELGGTSKLDFDPAGLRCVVTIPLRQLVDSSLPAAVTEQPVLAETRLVPLEGKRLLVVEDGALVAMEVADALEARGATVAGPASNLTQAIRLAVAEGLDGALLDVDLDGESVFPVADVLRERKVPFLFTTGFDAATVLPERFRGMTVLTKPYSGDDAADALAGMLWAIRPA